MATPTTLNIGEPADERPVDAGSVLVGDVPALNNFDSGDHEISGNGHTDAGTFQAASSPPTKPEIIVTHSGSPSHSQNNLANLVDTDSVAEYVEEFEEDNESTAYLAEGKKSFSLRDLFPEFLITTNDIFFKILPAVGAVSYGYFSLSVVDPQWFNRTFGELSRNVSNTSWILAHLGAGLYIYHRRHIRNLPIKQAVRYSLFGAVLFNFGSCMLWGLGRSWLKSCPTVRMLYGVASSGLMLYLGQDYLQCVDDKLYELD